MVSVSGTVGVVVGGGVKLLGTAAAALAGRPRLRFSFADVGRSESIVDVVGIESCFEGSFGFVVSIAFLFEIEMFRVFVFYWYFS